MTLYYIVGESRLPEEDDPWTIGPWTIGPWTDRAGAGKAAQEAAEATGKRVYITEVIAQEDPA